MKGKLLFTAASEVLLTALLAWSGVMCMVTAFSLTYAKLWVLPLWCLLSAAAVVLCCRWRRGLILAGILAGALGFWWYRVDMLLSLEALVHRISQYYDSGYGWGTVSWSGRELMAVELTAGLCAVCLLVTVAVGIKVAKGTDGLTGYLVAALPLAVCLVLKDTVPEELYLFLWLLGLLLLVMPRDLRIMDSAHAAQLTMMLLLPCGALLLLLFLLVPQEGYDGQENAQKLEDFVTAMVEKLPSPDGDTEEPSGSGDTSYWVNLQEVGPKEEQKAQVMTVVPGTTGVLYLRGRAFDYYDGDSWMTGTDWSLDTVAHWQDTWAEGSWEVLVSTQTVHSVLYLPYTCADTALLERMDHGRVTNSQRLTTYKVTQRSSVSYDASWESREISTGGLEWGSINLPQATLRRAKSHLERLGLSIEGEYKTMAQVWQTANLIADYVRSSAAYDLSTPEMPQGEDFAMWFLEESETGYCTHFASATAVLLRAAGIPARFVTGYMVQGAAGETVTVRLEDAHAWVEYYIEGAGWILLESTASMEEPPEEPAVEVTSSPTEPPQTTTEQTQPHETQPGETLEQTAPTTDLPRQEEKKPVKLIWLWWLPVLGAAVGQWRLRLYLFDKRLKKAGNDQRALILWRRARLLGRLLKQEPEQALYELALKAKFSQHSITEEELDTFCQSIDASVKELKKKDPIRRLLYRMVYALY